MATVTELQQSITDAAHAAAKATAFAVRAASEQGEGLDPSLAGQAREYATATRELCAALMALQRGTGPVCRPGGEPPSLYPAAVVSASDDG